MRESLRRVSSPLGVFNNFCSTTSMHGWSFFGSPEASCFQKFFWLVVILFSFSVSLWLIHIQTDLYLNSFTKINIEDRSAGLEDTYFPSVVVCNINPLRKSFIYWLRENIERSGLANVSSKDTFDLISQYFSPQILHTEQTKQLTEKILESEFFREYFEDFRNEKKNTEDINITTEMNKIFLYDFINDEEDLRERLGEYSESTRKTYHENFLHQLASQWKIGQMIPHIRWNGMDPDDRLGSGFGGVFLELSFGTNYGVCSFISPFYRMSPAGRETSLRDLSRGALNGENNGLTLLLGMANSFNE